MNSHVHLYLTISINLYKPFVLILFSDFEKQKHIVTLQIFAPLHNIIQLNKRLKNNLKENSV